jgi:stage II sporulation protein D
VNIVNMDDYLKGVVPAEMPPLWPLEAVKAQAVVARGYAYNKLKASALFDVRPTAANQVYAGARIEHSRSNLAVELTSGQVVMANGRVANTFFFTVGGGYTENNEYAWVSDRGKVVASPISYLRGVPDVDANGLAYDRGAGAYEWNSTSFTWAELGEMLATDARTDVGRLIDVSFERGVSGRVFRVTIVGSQRTAYVSGQVFKAVFNKRTNGPTLKSAMFYLERSN